MGHKNYILLIELFYTVGAVIAAVWFARKKIYDHLLECVLVYALLTAYLYFEYRAVFYTPAFILALVILAVLTHTLLGECVDLYHKSMVFDRYLHLGGSFSFALFAYSIIHHLLRPVGLHWLYVALFVTALGMAIGVVFEIMEYLHDVRSPKKPVSQHGLKDTDTDLIFNTIGSVLAGIASIFVF